MSEPRVLYLVVCGAGPASHAHQLVSLAIDQGWQVHVIATQAGLPFLDIAALQAQTGNPIRTSYRTPQQSQRRGPPADAIIVAPATFNTINKLAAGISDTYPLGVLAECIGMAPTSHHPAVHQYRPGKPFATAILCCRPTRRGRTRPARARWISASLTEHRGRTNQHIPLGTSTSPSHHHAEPTRTRISQYTKPPQH
jgi:hypothetical protein